MSAILKLNPITAEVWHEGERVSVRISQGKRAETFDMPPQVAIQIATSLERSARAAKAIQNARKAQRG